MKNLKSTHHIALKTVNFETMEKFYTETLGLTVTRRWDNIKIIFIDIGSTTIELIGRDDSPPPGSAAGAFDHIAFHVEDVDETFQELVDLGVKIKMEPKNVESVRIAFFYDPDGNSLELVEDPRAEGK